jgi:hypothetical protein
MQPNKRHLLGHLIACVTVLLTTGHASANDDGQLELNKIIKDWQRRREALHSVRYVLAGSTFAARGAYNSSPDVPRQGQDYPKNGETHDVTKTILLDFDKNRIRKETRGMIFYTNEGRFIPFSTIEVFDGKSFRVYRPRDGNYLRPALAPEHQEEISKQTDHYASWILNLADRPIFHAHGIVSCLESPIEPRQLRVSPALPAFISHRRGVVAGRRCSVFSVALAKDNPGTLMEHWVDLDRDSSIVRSIGFVENEPFAQLDVEHQKTPNGWLPAGWTITWFSRSKKQPKTIETSETLQVKASVINATLSDSEFELPQKAGMIIRDVEKSRFYRVGEDGQSLIDVTSVSAPSANLSWIWALVVIVVALLLVVPMRRWLNRKSPAGPAAA